MSERKSDYIHLKMWSFDVDLEVKSDMMMMLKLQHFSFEMSECDEATSYHHWCDWVLMK